MVQRKYPNLAVNQDTHRQVARLAKMIRIDSKLLGNDLPVSMHQAVAVAVAEALQVRRDRRSARRTATERTHQDAEEI